MSDPRTLLRQVHDRLAAAEPQVRIIRPWGPERERLADAVEAAIGHAALGTEAGCRAAIADLTGAAGVVAKFRDDASAPNARAVARAADEALPALRAIAWSVAPPALSVQGFGPVEVSSAAPVTATARLVLSAPAKTSVAATATIGGLAASDVAGGKLSFPVEVPAGASSAPLPVGFAAQALTADKAGSLALSAPSGATLGSPAGFPFVLKANAVRPPLPTVTLSGGDITPSRTAEVDGAVAVALSAPADHAVTAVYGIAGQRPGDLLSPATGPVVVPAGTTSATIPVRVAPLTLAAARPLTLALSGVAGAAQPFPAPLAFSLRASASSNNRSGLPFRDGANGQSNHADEFQWLVAFEQWRGRPLDITTLFPGTNEPFDPLMGQVKGQEQLIRDCDGRGLQIITTIPLITNHEGPGHFPDCARGAYDAWHEEAARFYAGLGLKHPVIVRLGHECDGTGTANPYPQDEAAGFANYKAAWDRIADVYHTNLPGCLLDWNHLRRGHPTIDWRRAQPSLDSFDVLGVDLYNGGNPIVNSTDTWQRYRDATGAGGSPAGPATWLAYAKSIGKPLGIAECAVTNKSNLAGDPVDDPTWCEQMFDWLVANGGDGPGQVIYAVYFHRLAEGHSHKVMQDNGHDAAPENVKAAAGYRGRRGGGR